MEISVQKFVLNEIFLTYFKVEIEMEIMVPTTSVQK